MRYIATVALATIALVAAWAFAHGRREPQLPVPAAMAENAAASVASSASSADSVRVERQLVRAQRVRTEAVAAERKKAPRPALRATRNTTQRVGFLTRARRALFGQGRHRPAPFPSVQ